MERMEMNRAGSSNKGLEWMRKIEVERMRSVRGLESGSIGRVGEIRK